MTTKTYTVDHATSSRIGDAYKACGNCGNSELDASNPAYGLVCQPCEIRVSGPVGTDLSIRPTNVMHPTVNAMVDQMRAAGREELVHYAGAAHRDLTAWRMCEQWLLDRDATESVLKSRVYEAEGCYISPEDIRSANPGMR
jgi:hypothetical protein